MPSIWRESLSAISGLMFWRTLPVQEFTQHVISKPWGLTWPVGNDRDIEVTYLEAVAGGFCSNHQHVGKANRFFLVRGKIRVAFYDESGEFQHDVVLEEVGSCVDAPPGVWHRFEAIEDSAAIEYYWSPPLRGNDIIRRDTGGIQNRRMH